MPVIDPTRLVCFRWRSNDYVLKVEWFVSETRFIHGEGVYSAWRARFHYTPDLNQAVIHSQRQWEKAMHHSKHVRLDGRGFRLLPIVPSPDKDNL